MRAAEREAIAIGGANSTLTIANSTRTILALNEAVAGHSFGDICQLVAFQNESQPAAERLAQFLVSWFTEGLVIGVTRRS